MTRVHRKSWISSWAILDRTATGRCCELRIVRGASRRASIKHAESILHVCESRVIEGNGNRMLLLARENVVSRSTPVMEVATRRLTCDVNRLMLCDRRSEVSSCDTRCNGTVQLLQLDMFDTFDRHFYDTPKITSRCQTRDKLEIGEIGRKISRINFHRVGNKFETAGYP